ncbi:MAG: IS66 family insertion sequence element accessory protein TnpA [Bryobacteraceae bacterium]
MNPKQEEKREVWRQRVAEHERVGQPVRAYCRELGIREHTFY